MNLYLLRHGIAEDRQAGRADARRALTPRGQRRIGRIARTMRRMDLRIDRVLTSPYERARRTAAIVADVFGAKCVEVDVLRPGADPRAVIAAVRASRADNVLLVGHEPMLSQLASVLLAGTPAASVTMKKGGLCKLSTAGLRYGRCASLDWLLTPRQMLRIR